MSDVRLLPRGIVADDPATLSRRSLLMYVGYGTANLLAGPALGPLAAAAEAVAAAAAAPGPAGWVRANGLPDWVPVAYPLPIPGDGGSADTDARRLARYDVKDALVLPGGFRHAVVARWGDPFGPAGAGVRFGYACDYTGLVPVAGTDDEHWLLVNHEYISARPWLQGWDEVLAAEFGPCPVTADGKLGGHRLAGLKVDLLDGQDRARLSAGELAAARTLCRAALSDLGVSVLRVRRGRDGAVTVVRGSPDHFRVTGLPDANRRFADAGRLRVAGPAAALIGTTATGTFANCSGATTPWGTFLTCEENFQDQVAEHVRPDGSPLAAAGKRFAGVDQPVGDHPAGDLPFEFEGLGTGVEPPLDGRQFGWVCEVDPASQTLTKLTGLGRFRHENVSLRVAAGRRLAAYMGDDRRGGHLWKFVSDDVVTDPSSPATAALLRKGTLHAARLDADYTGRWVPLAPGTPVAKPSPEDTADGVVWLPARPAGGHVLVGTAAAAGAEASVRQWQARVERFAGKPLERVTLGDLVRGADAQAVILTDAFAMANAAGATPCARPEDVEVHPADGSVYVAFTDTTGSRDGSPDESVFPDSAKRNSRQYGAIYRLREDGDDPAAGTFTWGRFVAAGELADLGGGFACADNLAFDPAGHLWVVCDVTTPAHNFPVTRSAADGSEPGDKNFLGVFGNNAMFVVPTAGPLAGVPHCFAVGPTECELTGPTFTPDGRTLLLSVQHPGELHGTRRGGGRPGDPRGLRDADERALVIADRQGRLFEQRRRVPLGSNFPAKELGQVPRPCVVCVTRA